jgi:uncharacterized membrane protein YeaQ/YmgE (transglycosylase-associated protein family)
MNANTGQLIVWVVIGALAGTLASALLYRGQARVSQLSNIVLGLLGALVGGALFNLFGIRFGLPTLTFSIDDLVAAFVGAVILLLAMRVLRR